MLSLDIRTNFSNNFYNIRVERNLTINQLKEKLVFITGATLDNMQIKILKKDGTIWFDDLNITKTLADYIPDTIENIDIEVIDNTIKKGMYDDLNAIPKLEISDQEYSNRPNSARKFLAEMGYNKVNGDKNDSNKINLLKNMNIGDRCKIILNGLTKLGTIMYKGSTDFKPGVWVGVKYDEPLGKNDGSVNGKRYFVCDNKYGGFVRPESVIVGDFPEETFDDDIEI